MKYIPRIDELLTAAPYQLGIDNQSFRFECNTFILDACNNKLNQIVQDQLNAAIPSGKATCDSSGPQDLKYWVPPRIQRVLLSFFRYWRAESKDEPGKGWMAYTETMIGFYIERERIASDLPNEAFLYLGAVYIDDSAYKGQLVDPHSIPIVLGREAYGMPKNPGQIFYCPQPHDPYGAKLQMWDSDGGPFALTDAIVVDPDMDEAQRGACPIVLQSGGAPTERDEAGRYRVLAAMLDLDPEELVRRLREAPQPLGTHARLLRLPEAQRERERDVVVQDDLLFHVMLVGLKQFPDPKSKFQTNQPLDACYQAIVETPLEEDPDNKLPAWDQMYDGHAIEFPKVSHISLPDRFGIIYDHNDPKRRIDVARHRIFYQHGTLIFANPDRVRVWDPEV
jgi:hypothetical protein